MLPDWQEVIDDESEQKVFQALAHPDWDFRTVEGIVRETSLPEPLVWQVIEKHLGTGLIRESLSLGQTGQRLFTLGKNRIRNQEAMRFLRQFMAKSIE
jgi:hypothetical protein